MQQIAKMLGTGISILTLLLSLVSSWTYFYSEQKINTLQLASQAMTIERHEEDLKSIYTQQNKLIEIVSYNTKDISSVQINIEKLLDLQHKNQLYLTRIATKVGADK